MLKKKWNEKLVELGIYSTYKTDKIEALDENLTFYKPGTGEWVGIDITTDDTELMTALMIQQTEYLKSIHSNVTFLTIVVGINFLIAICGFLLAAF